MWLKSITKRFLHYVPLEETNGVRHFLAGNDCQTSNLSFTPSHEGDLMYSLIRTGGYTRCLEIGFYTGSSALYMLAAVSELDEGHVTSIDYSETSINHVGQHNVAAFGYADRHTFIGKTSQSVLPDLVSRGEKIDFVYVDGWKTFDHLAFELYLIDQMLGVGGAIMFDDSELPGVRRSIQLLKLFYGYEEVNYSRHNQNWRLRIFLFLTTRTPRRTYRALIKRIATVDQDRHLDWHFDRSL